MTLPNVSLLNRSLAAALTAACLFGRPGLAPAQSFDDLNDNAKIMIHLVSANQVSGNPCRSSRATTTCDQMKVAGNLLESYYAYVVITDASADVGIAGVQFGVKYNTATGIGVDIDEWSHCGTLTFPTGGENWWKARTNGNMVTWDANSSCQRFEPSGPGTGVTAVVGYFYLSAQTPDRLEVVPRAVDSAAKVADCTSKETLVAGTGVFRPRSHLGYVEFSDRSSTAGYNPCGLARPVLDATWGEVKASGSGK